MGMWMAIGIAIGVAIGAMYENVVMGVVIGLILGIAFASINKKTGVCGRGKRGSSDGEGERFEKRSGRRS